MGERAGDTRLLDPKPQCFEVPSAIGPVRPLGAGGSKPRAPDASPHLHAGHVGVRGGRCSVSPLGSPGGPAPRPQGSPASHEEARAVPAARRTPVPLPTKPGRDGAGLPWSRPLRPRPPGKVSCVGAAARSAEPGARAEQRRVRQTRG